MRAQPFQKRGRTPVAKKAPSTAPFAATPVWRNAKISCIAMVSPSMPVISARLTTRRLPSDSRASWITAHSAAATCCRAARCGRPRPAMAAMFSSRVNASRGVLA